MTASAFTPSAWMTWCGFCHSSRAGLSKTCAHFSASPKPCRRVSGDWAVAAHASASPRARMGIRIIASWYGEVGPPIVRAGPPAGYGHALFGVFARPPWTELAHLLALLGRQDRLDLVAGFETRLEH